MGCPLSAFGPIPTPRPFGALGGPKRPGANILPRSKAAEPTSFPLLQGARLLSGLPRTHVALKGRERSGGHPPDPPTLGVPGFWGPPHRPPPAQGVLGATPQIPPQPQGDPGVSVSLEPPHRLPWCHPIGPLPQVPPHRPPAQRGLRDPHSLLPLTSPPPPPRKACWEPSCWGSPGSRAGQHGSPDALSSLGGKRGGREGHDRSPVPQGHFRGVPPHHLGPQKPLQDP